MRIHFSVFLVGILLSYALVAADGPALLDIDACQMQCAGYTDPTANANCYNACISQVMTGPKGGCDICSYICNKELASCLYDINVNAEPNNQKLDRDKCMLNNYQCLLGCKIPKPGPTED